LEVEQRLPGDIPQGFELDAVETVPAGEEVIQIVLV
jgi:hypothetical protein